MADAAVAGRDRQCARQWAAHSFHRWFGAESERGSAEVEGHGIFIHRMAGVSPAIERLTIADETPELHSEVPKQAAFGMTFGLYQSHDTYGLLERGVGFRSKVFLRKTPRRDPPLRFVPVALPGQTFDFPNITKRSRAGFVGSGSAFANSSIWLRQAEPSSPRSEQAGLRSSQLDDSKSKRLLVLLPDGSCGDGWR
jgi:hypothetical protein